MSLMDEFFAKRKQMMRGVVARVAWDDVQPKLVAEVELVVQGSCIEGAKVLKPPGPKNLVRGQEKVDKLKGEMQGEWLGITDMARCTVAVPHDFQIEQMLKLLKPHFSQARNGFQYYQTKEARPELMAGYSGWTLNAIRSGVYCEIQVNTKAMLYAKSLPEFRSEFGDEEGSWKALYPLVPGGLGHVLYDVARSDNEPPERRAEFKKASQAYYDYFRSKPADPALGRAASIAIRKVHVGPWSVGRGSYRSGG